jgi:hypothetical protein
MLDFTTCHAEQEWWFISLETSRGGIMVRSKNFEKSSDVMHVPV